MLSVLCVIMNPGGSEMSDSSEPAVFKLDDVNFRLLGDLTTARQRMGFPVAIIFIFI